MVKDDLESLKNRKAQQEFGHGCTDDFLLYLSLEEGIYAVCVAFGRKGKIAWG
ncbi:MAG: hypothetical protein WBA93_08110 [Microcoleaceae cyanobacterium]